SAAQGFTLDFYGDKLISFQLGDEIVDTLTSADGTPLKALVKNDGTIEVAGGDVWITAEAAREVVNQSINLSGVVRAGSVSAEGGMIRLSGSGAVAVEKGAVVDASGGQGGGTVRIEGDQFTNQGTIDVSGGPARGGDIAIEARVAGLGGSIHADGAEGGSIEVRAEDNLSLGDTVSARGTAGAGGSIRYETAGGISETSSGSSDVSGTSRGGDISVQAGTRLGTSGRYAAD